MGRASVRKRPLDLVMQPGVPGPHNDPEIAAEVLRAYQSFMVTASCIEALAGAGGSPAFARALRVTAENIRVLQKGLAAPAAAASATLGRPLPSMAGLNVTAADGSVVAVDASGMVQHTAPDDVLVSLGLPVSHAKPKGVRKALK